MDRVDHLTVREALEAFYVDQKLDQQIPQNFINYYPLGWIKIPFINLPARRRLLHLHDLNHIIMGFDTSISGEAQLAALELASGFPFKYKIGYLYSPFALLPGLLTCPLKVFKAFLRGRTLKNSCHLELTKAEVLNTRVSEIKKRLELIHESRIRGAT